MVVRSPRALAAGVALLATLAVVGNVRAASPTEIRSLISTVAVFTSGSLEVREQLTLVTTGDTISRTLSQDVREVRQGSRATPSWRVQRVSIDGKQVSWRLSSPSPSRLMLDIGGDVAPGLHTLDLTFITDRFVAADTTRADLTWDATGAWNAPVAQAVIVVSPPPGAERALAGAGASLQSAVGRIGSLPAVEDMDGGITIRADRQLTVGEHLVVHAAWPGGFVRAPTGGMRVDWFIRDWGGVVMGLLGLLVLAGYFQSAWNSVGRDPPQTAIIPRFVPPEGMSPAAVRYIRRMAFDSTAFAANLLDMGSHGAVTVTQERGTTVLRRTGMSAETLPPDEQVMADCIFGTTQGALTITQYAQPVLQSAQTALRRYLDTHCCTEYFGLHRRETLVGIGISFVTAVVAGMAQATTRASALAYLFLLAWLSIWSAGVAFVWSSLVRTWKTPSVARPATPTSFLGALTIGMATTAEKRAQRASTSMALYFSGFWFVGAGMFFRVATVPVAVLVVAMAVLDVVYGRLMPSWTLRGRQAVDEADGFALYLKVAEKQRMHWFHPPEKTPELLERYLPYALALGVQQEWAEQFREMVERSTTSATV
ncbi:MAG: DUF2207 domain-containing protein [Caldiserica bacterium]|nr:DUF2207 domain-containing protein [Caldisericota bacterium]